MWMSITDSDNLPYKDAMHLENLHTNRWTQLWLAGAVGMHLTGPWFMAAKSLRVVVTRAAPLAEETLEGRCAPHPETSLLESLPQVAPKFCCFQKTEKASIFKQSTLNFYQKISTSSAQNKPNFFPTQSFERKIPFFKTTILMQKLTGFLKIKEVSFKMNTSSVFLKLLWFGVYCILFNTSVSSDCCFYSQ